MKKSSPTELQRHQMNDIITCSDDNFRLTLSVRLNGRDPPTADVPNITKYEAFWSGYSIMRIEDLEGLGPKSAEMLARAGIATAEDLHTMGAVQAFVSVKRADEPASLNLLWALEGAVTGRHWKDVAKTERTRLLIALDQFEHET
jgi:DNA transformation protein